MKKIKLLLLIIACANIFGNCKKPNNITDEPQLPPETQTGAYTFGCKVDGVIYKATGRASFLANQSVSYAYYSSDSSFNISATNSATKKFRFSMTFKCTNINLPSTLIEYYPYGVSFQDISNGTAPSGSNTYNTDNLRTGNVTIKFFNGTLAPGNFGSILSGTFDFYAINANGKIIHVTEGRFDSGI